MYFTFETIIFIDWVIAKLEFLKGQRRGDEPENFTDCGSEAFSLIFSFHNMVTHLFQ